MPKSTLRLFQISDAVSQKNHHAKWCNVSNIVHFCGMTLFVRMLVRLLGLLFVFPLNSMANAAPNESTVAPTVISYPESSDPTNPHLQYELKVLKLALDRTRKSYGEYQLQTYMRPSWGRMMRDLNTRSRTNDLHVLGYSTKKDGLKTLAYVKFPVYLGALGYRVCFVSEQAKDEFAKVQNLQDLRKFTHGQGFGWVDSSVLEYNKLKVVEFEGAPRLIRMTARNDVQVFCRGIGEIKKEVDDNQGVAGLYMDKSIALYYPHLRFFFTHSSNKTLIARMEEGLKLAYEDGSLLRLFMDVHRESFTFVDMPSRRVISLENPFLEGVDFDYSKYIVRFDHHVQEIGR